MNARQSESPIKRQTVASALVDELRQRILNLDMAEGEQLRQDTVAETYGVSRIPVREALLQLEAEGLVSGSHHRGYTVTRLSLADIRELFDLRALIEPDLLQHAMPHIGEADLERAREVLATFDGMLAQESSVGEWGELNWRLHSALYAPAARERSLQIARNLHHNADRYLRLQLRLGGHATAGRARDEHRRLVDLCAAGETAEAVRLLNAHILSARDDLLVFLAERRAQPAAEGEHA